MSNIQPSQPTEKTVDSQLPLINLNKSKKFYVTNKELCEHVTKFKLTCKYDENGKYIPNSGRIHDEFGKAILMVARNICTRGCFAGYTWTDDMISEGVLTVCKYLHNCNLEKSTNVFAYLTQIINNAFKIYLKAQKKQSIIKDTLIKDAGYDLVNIIEASKHKEE